MSPYFTRHYRSTSTQLNEVFKFIFSRYFPFKNTSVVGTMQGFLKENYRKNLFLKNTHLIKSRYLMYLPFFLFLLIFTSCKNKTNTDYYTAPTFTEKGINAVIEIPAGTNHKIEVNPITREFENDKKNGKIRIVDFLPYPGNYGYIPSTYMDPEKGGDGDALDVLVICESLPTGTMIEVIPIATLQLLDGGEIDDKVIAVPVDPRKRVINALNFQSFAVDYSMAQNIIQNWFLNYKGLGKMKLVAWQNEIYTIKDIKKWEKKKE